ncbi:plasmid SOS inhibition protein A [Pantoea sp. PNT02]|uniref:plasmid SOS inhibition protein A n=1 Tax=Pantoea sp. PNT02 TaxID=2769261 RepID=UPI001784F8BB|nr:plasmid SOS inhibition protein A [Pantoea sp. PNT02]MBD9646370.1 plasmid SOS inhibition protein A [Pantoea sp. PNT02]
MADVSKEETAMNTIPGHFYLISVCPYTREVGQTIADIEKRQQGRGSCGQHPCASAFIRHYFERNAFKAANLRRGIDTVQILYTSAFTY